jgi:hypothetical protein
MNEHLKMASAIEHTGHPTVEAAMELSKDSTFAVSQSRLTQYRNEGCGGGKRRASPNYKSMPWPQLESNSESSVYDTSPEGNLAVAVNKGIESTFDGTNHSPMKGSIAPVGDSKSISKTINMPMESTLASTHGSTYGSSLGTYASSSGSFYGKTKIAAMGAAYDLMNYDQIPAGDYESLYGSKMAYIFYRDERAPSLTTCAFVFVILIVLMSYLIDM